MNRCGQVESCLWKHTEPDTNKVRVLTSQDRFTLWEHTGTCSTKECHSTKLQCNALGLVGELDDTAVLPISGHGPANMAEILFHANTVSLRLSTSVDRSVSSSMSCESQLSNVQESQEVEAMVCAVRSLMTYLWSSVLPPVVHSFSPPPLPRLRRRRSQS